MIVNRIGSYSLVFKNPWSWKLTNATRWMKPFLSSIQKSTMIEHQVLTLCFSKIDERFQFTEPLQINYHATPSCIRRVHPSESVTITACQREPAGWKGECLLNECWMNVMLIWDLIPFSSVIALRIPISSMALHDDTSTARFELVRCSFIHVLVYSLKLFSCFLKTLLKILIIFT